MENNFLSRVSAVQTELKAPKGRTNKFGGYKYRSCEDIMEAVKPLLAKHELLLTVSDELECIGDRYYIHATATLWDTASTDCLSNSAYARESEDKKGMDDSQITGTASSYARKYALNGLFCIDDTKDADTDEFAKEQAAAEQRKEYRCDDCGELIYPVKKRDGKPWDVKDMVSYANRRFGRQLCVNCMKRVESEGT